jgi:hypothetical protein
MTHTGKYWRWNEPSMHAMSPYLWNRDLQQGSKIEPCIKTERQWQWQNERGHNMLQTRQADSPRVPPQPSGISLSTLKSNVSHGRATSGHTSKSMGYGGKKDLATSFKCLHSSFNISAQFPCNRILHGFSICQNRHRIFSIVNHTCQNIDLASATAVQDSPDPCGAFNHRAGPSRCSFNRCWGAQPGPHPAASHGGRGTRDSQVKIEDLGYHRSYIVYFQV